MLFRPLLVKWPCSDANCGSAAATRWKRTNWLSTKHVLARLAARIGIGIGIGGSGTACDILTQFRVSIFWFFSRIHVFRCINTHISVRGSERGRAAKRVAWPRIFAWHFSFSLRVTFILPPPKSNPLFCHQENSPLAASSLEIFLIASKLRRFHRLPYVTSYVRGDTVYSYSLCVSLIFLVMNVYPRYDAFVYMYLNIQYSISISITSVMNKNQKTKDDGMMGWWDLAWYSLGFFCNLIICSSFFSDI